MSPSLLINSSRNDAMAMLIQPLAKKSVAITIEIVKRLVGGWYAMKARSNMVID